MPIVFLFVCPLSFAFHCLAAAPCHFLSIFFHAVLSDIVNAGRTVGFEQNRENLADKIGISSAFPYIATAFCTGIVSLVNAASAYFAPFRLFVFNAARAFPRQEFAASSAIETARCYVFFVCFHIRFIFAV